MFAAGVVAPATAEAVLSVKWFKKVIDGSIIFSDLLRDECFLGYVK